MKGTLTARVRRAASVAVVTVSIAVLALALLGPFFTSSEGSLIVGVPYEPPSGEFLLGTDARGRDVWQRVLLGGRSLLLVPLGAVALTLVIGAVAGILAGLRGGVAELVVMRLGGVLMCVPPVLLMLVLLHGWGYSPLVLVTLIAAVGAPFVARLARTTTLQLVHTGFVEQALGEGERTSALVVRHVVPCLVRPLLADAGTRLAVSVTLTASAGFLGFAPESPNWGGMVSQNLEGVSLTPWGVVVPAMGVGMVAVSAHLSLDRLASLGER